MSERVNLIDFKKTVEVQEAKKPLPKEAGKWNYEAYREALRRYRMGGDVEDMMPKPPAFSLGFSLIKLVLGFIFLALIIVAIAGLMDRR